MKAFIPIRTFASYLHMGFNKGLSLIVHLLQIQGVFGCAGVLYSAEGRRYDRGVKMTKS